MRTARKTDCKWNESANELTVDQVKRKTGSPGQTELVMLWKQGGQGRTPLSKGQDPKKPSNKPFVYPSIQLSLSRVINVCYSRPIVHYEAPPAMLNVPLSSLCSTRSTPSSAKLLLIGDSDTERLAG